MTSGVSLIPIEPSTNSSPNPSHIILCTEWLDNCVNLKIFHPDKLTSSIIGTVSLEELRQRAGDFEIPEDEFIEETRKCWATNNGLEGFKYYFNSKNQDQEDLSFTWKKTTGTLTLIYGSVELQLNSSSDGLVGILTGLQMRNGELEEENRRLQKDNKDLLMCHEELIKAQKNTETDILSKCRLLINSKKDRIRELKEELQKFKDNHQNHSTPDDSETPVIVPIPGRKRNTTHQILSESSQPYSSDDSLPLAALLPRRRDLVDNQEPPSKRISLQLDNDTQDITALVNAQDSQDCNRLFDDL